MIFLVAFWRWRCCKIVQQNIFSCSYVWQKRGCPFHDLPFQIYIYLEFSVHVHRVHILYRVLRACFWFWVHDKYTEFTLSVKWYLCKYREITNCLLYRSVSLMIVTICKICFIKISSNMDIKNIQILKRGYRGLTRIKMGFSLSANLIILYPILETPFAIAIAEFWWLGNILISGNHYGA